MSPTKTFWFLAKFSFLFYVFFLGIFADSSPPSNLNFLECVRNYAIPEKCAICKGKEPIGGDINETLAKMIENDYIIWRKPTSFTANCKNCSYCLNVTGCEVRRMPNELVDMLKSKFWFDPDRMSQDYHDAHQTILLEQYAAFKEKYGSMSTECMRIFDVKFEDDEPNVPESGHKEADDDDEEPFIKHLVYLAGGVLSAVGFVVYILRRIYRLYRDAIELKRDYSNLIADSESHI